MTFLKPLLRSRVTSRLPDSSNLRMGSSGDKEVRGAGPGGSVIEPVVERVGAAVKAGRRPELRKEGGMVIEVGDKGMVIEVGDKGMVAADKSSTGTKLNTEIN